MVRWILSGLQRAAGFDPAIVEQIAASHRTRLTLVALLFALSAVLIGSALGYGIGLVEQSMGIGVLVSLLLSGFMVSLYRTVNAGSGPGLACSARQLLRWRPSEMPLLGVSVFAWCAAQPIPHTAGSERSRLR